MAYRFFCILGIVSFLFVVKAEDNTITNALLEKNEVISCSLKAL